MTAPIRPALPSDHVVRRRRKAAVGNMLRLVPQGLEPARQSGGELSIDKKTQLRAPEHRMIMLACCELKNRDDVLGLQVRQVLQDLLSRRSRRKEFQNVCDTDAQAADAGSSSTHCDVCCDPIHLTQHQLLQTISTLSIIAHRCGLSPRRIPRNGDRHGVGFAEPALAASDSETQDDVRSAGHRGQTASWSGQRRSADAFRCGSDRCPPRSRRGLLPRASPTLDHGEIRARRPARS